MNEIRLPLASALVLAMSLAGPPAPAQQSFLPVNDLLCERIPRGVYLEILRSSDLCGARRFAGEGYLGGVLRGEEDSWDDEWFCDVGARGHFGRDQLCSLLAALGLPGEVSLLGSHLRVPQERAETARTILENLRQALPPQLRITVRLVQRTDQGERVRIARTVTCDPGRLEVISEVRRRRAVVDYDVEIAEATSIANPRVVETRAGAMVALRPQLAPSAEWGVLEVIARCVDEPGTELIDPGHPAFGPLDRVPMQIGELGRVVPVRPGSRVVERWSGALGTFELTLETQWNLARPARPGGHDFGVFTMRGDLRGFRSVAVPPSAYAEDRALDPERDAPWQDIREIAGPGADWLDPGSEGEEAGAQPYVALDQEFWAAGAAVTPWFEAQRETAAGTVTCYSVPRLTPWPANGGAPDGAVELGGTSFVQVAGTWSATTVRAEHSVLRDWDVEVASSSRIPDPRCERISTGLVLNARCRGDELEVEGELSRQLDPGRRKLALSAPIFAPEVGSGEGAEPGNVARSFTSSSPKLAQVADEVYVEHPTVVTVPVHFTRQVEAGARAVWRTSADTLLGEGRDLVLVVARGR